MKPFKAVIAQMQQSWNKGDAAAFAAVFGAEADFIDLMGGHSVGQQAIAASHKTLFAGAYKGSKVAYTVEKMKPLAPTVMVLFLRLQLTLQREGKAVQMQARPTLTLRRGQAGWRISVYQGTRVTEAPAAVTAKAGAAAPAAVDDKKPVAKKK
jgi:uncharacterized protein (TIGR02246 family)